MSKSELIEILHNIPQEVLQSKNHEKLRLVINHEEPSLKLIAFSAYEVLTLTLYDSIHYSIWSTRSFKDIKNQVKSYLNILGFKEIQWRIKN